MTAFYNEIDPYAAAWLRNLVAAGHIAQGVVDERSIEDIEPAELDRYTQCHFFAGIGVWSHALRLAGWPDDRPVWTGSCPCQPFSAAGKGAGFDDERHLWPAFHWLISQYRPPVVFGEQVASKDGLNWLDLVQVDLEGSGYATGASDLCAAGIGAPHIRQRLYWVADGDATGRGKQWVGGLFHRERASQWNNAHGRGEVRGMDNNNNKGLEGHGLRHTPQERRIGTLGSVAEAGESGGMGDANEVGRQQFTDESRGDGEGVGSGRGQPVQLGEAVPHAGGVVDAHDQRHERHTGTGREAQRRFEHGSDTGRPNPTHGHWRDADWLFCRDGKWRPVEPGTFPLAYGATARVGRLRAYGNAIVPQVAQAFVEAYLARSP